MAGALGLGAPPCDRQPRVTPTASTIVSASTISTALARNADRNRKAFWVTGPLLLRLVPRPSRRGYHGLRVRDLDTARAATTLQAMRSPFGSPSTSVLTPGRAFLI